MFGGFVFYFAFGGEADDSLGEMTGVSATFFATREYCRFSLVFHSAITSPHVVQMALW
jgi:hypothetical protein